MLRHCMLVMLHCFSVGVVSTGAGKEDENSQVAKQLVGVVED